MEFRKIGFLTPKIQIGIIVALFLISCLQVYLEFQQTNLMYGLPANTLVVLAPIYEELIFRGIILGAFLVSVGKKNAIIFSSILFGLWHFKNTAFMSPEMILAQVLYAGIILGPIFAYVTIRVQTVWLAVILHYVNNIWSPISFAVLGLLFPDGVL